MRTPDLDQLAVRLPFVSIEAKGPNATRTVGRAVLILAMAAGTLAVSASNISSSVLLTLGRLWQLF
jgi:hypothetical protein